MMSIQSLEKLERRCAALHESLNKIQDKVDKAIKKFKKRLFNFMINKINDQVCLRRERLAVIALETSRLEREVKKLTIAQEDYRSHRSRVK